MLEIAAIRASGVITLVGVARTLTELAVPTPNGSTVWTHTTVARLLAGHLLVVGSGPPVLDRPDRGLQRLVILAGDLKVVLFAPPGPRLHPEIVRAEFHGEWNYTIRLNNRSERAVDP